VFKSPLHCILWIVFVFRLAATSVHGDGTGPFTAQALEPTGDRWMYPSNSTPGTRITASTFSFLPFTGADDRFGQFVIGFNTAAMGIPTGLGPENYEIHHLVLTAVYASNDPLPYDPSEDPLTSLGAAPSTADPDAGRPLELHGTGFRNGFNALSFVETSPYGNRNAFALGFDENGVAQDLTNNVTRGIPGSPWATGSITTSQGQALLPGEIIPAYSQVSFTIRPASPEITRYLQQGLHQGILWFTLSSFHPVTGPGSSGFPTFFTKEHPEQALYGDVAPRLSVEYSLPLRILSFERTTDTASLTWNASPGYQYIIQSSEDLGATGWVERGTRTSPTPDVLTWTGTSPQHRAFFRIIRNKLP
jgi:hypothetical protein